MSKSSQTAAGAHGAAARALGCVVVLGALGCVPACTSAPSAPSASAVRIGTGAFVFIPIVTGDAVPIIHGPQGGYHIWGSVLARDLGERLALDFVLTLADGTPVTTIHTSARVAALDDQTILLDAGHGDAGPVDFVLPGGTTGWGAALGSFVFLTDPGTVERRAVRLSVTASGGAGHSASDSCSFVPYLP